METITATKLGTAEVIVDIVRKGNSEIRPETYMNPEYLTIHNTGNAAVGADAEMHNTYIHNLSSYSPRDTSHVSWHFTVDDKFIYQHLPLDEMAWHCGDGANGTGNTRSIGIEICMNPDMDYKQAEENAIALAVYLMKVLNINVQNVKPHQAWSGKYCPAIILTRDGSFKPFSKRIESAYNGDEVTQVSNPVETAPAPTKRSYMKLWDKGSDVKKLQADLKELGYDLAVDGSFGKGTLATVKKFQEDYGLEVDGYAGKATQTKLKALLADGGNVIGKRVESIYGGSEGLNFYSKASFAKKYKVGVLKKGYGFPTILAKVKVGKSYMYKVKNSSGSVFYLTASSKFVKVEGSASAVRYCEVTADVWTQRNAYFMNTGRVKIRFAGQRFKVLASKGGYYKIGAGEWLSSKYSKLV